MQQFQPIPGVKKIAVLKANALGDLIFAVPALKALRETYPSAEIVYLGKAWHADFLPERVPVADRCEVLPAVPGISAQITASSNREDVEEFVMRMQSEQFDLALQLHGAGDNSNPFTKQLCAKMTVGPSGPRAERLGISIPYRQYQNDVMRWLEVVSRVGAYTKDIVPTVNVLERDIVEARLCLRNYGIHEKYIVLHPGATDPRRRWSPKKFAVVGDGLSKHGYHVVITGSESDEAQAKSDLRSLMTQPAAVVDGLSIGGLAALLKNAALVVSNDTGPLHLANAVGGKTVGIMWIGYAILATPLTMSNHFVRLSWRCHCPLCGKYCVDGGFPYDDTDCAHNVSFVDDVTVESVMNDCELILGLNSRA